MLISQRRALAAITSHMDTILVAAAGPRTPAGASRSADGELVGSPDMATMLHGPMYVPHSDSAWRAEDGQWVADLNSSFRSVALRLVLKCTCFTDVQYWVCERLLLAVRCGFPFFCLRFLSHAASRIGRVI